MHQGGLQHLIFCEKEEVPLFKPMPRPMSFLHFPRPAAQLVALGSIRERKKPHSKAVVIIALKHFELTEQLCGSPHLPLFKTFSLTSFYLRDKVWMFPNDCLWGGKPQPRQEGLLLSWHEFQWGGGGAQTMCSSQHPMHGDSLFPSYFALGGAPAWVLHVTHIRLLSRGAGRLASSTAETKGHFKSGDKADF